MSEAISSYRDACRGFSTVVAQAEGRWRRPSPCSDWDAGGVVEHVIGVHDELLLGPLGLTPERPAADPAARWTLTVNAINSAMDQATHPGIDLDRLSPALTGEVLIHTWDLAKAIGVDPHLDVQLCQASLEFLQSNEDQVRSSGLFGSEVMVPTNADPATQLVAFSGRDVEWVPPE
jgi:uncharacterized protein (TIGR03083 family)